MIELREGSSVLRVSERGATVTSWEVEGLSVLFPETDDLVVDGTKKRRGGMPICFPLLGSCDWFAKKHGFLRDTQMEVRFENEECVSLALESAGVAPWFPYPFTVEVVIGLYEEGRGLSSVVNVTNRGDENMFLGPAWHPYFSTPEGQAKVMNGEIVFQDITTDTFGPQPWHTMYNSVGLQILGLGHVDIRLFESTGEDFKLLGWRDDPRYFCLEPMTAHPRDMSRRVLPNSRWTARCDFTFTPE